MQNERNQGGVPAGEDAQSQTVAGILQQGRRLVLSEPAGPTKCTRSTLTLHPSQLNFHPPSNNQQLL